MENALQGLISYCGDAKLSAFAQCGMKLMQILHSLSTLCSLFAGEKANSSSGSGGFVVVTVLLSGRERKTRGFVFAVPFVELSASPTALRECSF